MKIKINKYSMMRNGTVAVITMLVTYILFGVKNMMIAFPIALTSTVLGRQNFQVKTLNKSMYILFIDVVIVIASYISSINMYTGIFINFISIFLIIYCMVSFYDPGFYKPFIMLYVFTQYASITLKELPLRILSVLFGVFAIVLGSYIKRINEKSTLGNSIKLSLELIYKSLELIEKNKFNEDIEESCSRIMRDLAYRIYITRHKKYLTTNLGRVQFDIYIAIEYLNLYLREIYKGFNSNVISERHILDIKNVIDQIIDYSKGGLSVEGLKKNIDSFIEKNKISNEYMKEVSEILYRLMNSIIKLDIMDYKEINQVYKEWERTEIDMFKNSFKSYFNRNSIRFKFAMRMSLTLTFTLLIGKILGLYKIIWAIITVMSIMQPYYEDTIAKTKERVIGNVIAILVAGISIHLIDSKMFTILMVVSALYLLYGFKEYYLISLFAAIASIGIASLIDNNNRMLIYRISYVLIGAVIVLIANRIIFPYRLEDGIEQLMGRIRDFNSIIINDFNIIVSNNDDKILKNNRDEIRDVIIHSTLMSQKLYLRNIQYKEERIDKFIKDNNSFIIKLAFKVTGA